MRCGQTAEEMETGKGLTQESDDEEISTCHVERTETGIRNNGLGIMGSLHRL